MLQSVVNRWWMITYDGNTFVISDKEQIIKSRRLGFVLKKDGTFEKIQHKNCAQDHLSPPAGKWSISQDTVRFENDIDPRMLIVTYVDETTLKIN